MSKYGKRIAALEKKVQELVARRQALTTQAQELAQEQETMVLPEDIDKAAELLASVNSRQDAAKALVAGIDIQMERTQAELNQELEKERQETAQALDAHAEVLAKRIDGAMDDLLEMIDGWYQCRLERSTVLNKPNHAYAYWAELKRGIQTAQNRREINRKAAAGDFG